MDTTNITSIVLLLLVSSTRANLGLMLLTAFSFSWVGPIVDPVTHVIGHSLLTYEPLRPMWIAMMNTPVVPWTDFNNTVVLGSFALGLVLVYPLYRATLPFFERYTPDISERLLRFRAVQLLWGAEFGGRLMR